MTRIGPKQPEPTGRVKQINPKRELLETSELVSAAPGPIFNRTLGTSSTLKDWEINRKLPKKGTNEADKTMHTFQKDRSIQAQTMHWSPRLATPQHKKQSH
jgi:hypothetical protein